MWQDMDDVQAHLQRLKKYNNEAELRHGAISAYLLPGSLNIGEIYQCDCRAEGASL